MNNNILELEKSLFKYEYMSNVDYLNSVIDDNYLEVGKSGYKITKSDVIEELSKLDEDRNIIIYNFSCSEISNDIFLVHYFTKKESDNIFRTSIWKKENNDYKIFFHQATLYKDEINLIEF